MRGRSGGGGGGGGVLCMFLAFTHLLISTGKFNHAIMSYRQN